MIIDVDPASPVPAYEQVRVQLAEMITTGVLPVGTRLAPIRQLASDLALAPGTVARVYRELEQEGLVVSRVRHGTVVAPVTPQSAARSRESLHAQARSFAAAAARLGHSLEDAVGAVRDEWGALAAEAASGTAE